MSNATVAPSKPYTAIVYFHGIGRQRRYEEISRLIDGLDKYSFYSSSDRKVQLRRQKNEIEPGRGSLSEDVEYISARKIIYTNGKPPTRSGLIRIYEAYWSHALAGGYSGLRVLFWIVARLINPFRGLFQVWRFQPRLKLAQLYRMQNEPSDPGTVGPYVRLETIYRDFENWPARRLYSRGSFRQFKKYLKNRCEPQILNETMFVVKEWRRKFVLSQISLILFAITIVIAIINLCGWFWIAIDDVRGWEVDHTTIRFLTDDLVRVAVYMVLGCGSVYLLVRTITFFRCMYLI